MAACDGLFLPYDILWEIISSVWHSSLSAEERVRLMTTSLLVSKTWLEICLRVMAKDTHIPSSSYFKRYTQIIRQAHPLCPSVSFNDLTRSLTVVVHSSIPGKRNLLAEVLYEINLIGALPYIRSLAVRYEKIPLDDLFDCFQFIDFPRQVKELDVLYVPQNPKLATRITPGLGPMVDLYPSWYLPSLKRLSIRNCNPQLLAAFLAACADLEVLEIDLDEEQCQQVHGLNTLTTLNYHGPFYDPLAER